MQGPLPHLENQCLEVSQQQAQKHCGHSTVTPISRSEAQALRSVLLLGPYHLQATGPTPSSHCLYRCLVPSDTPSSKQSGQDLGWAPHPRACKFMLATDLCGLTGRDGRDPSNQLHSGN